MPFASSLSSNLIGKEINIYFIKNFLLPLFLPFASSHFSATKPRVLIQWKFSPSTFCCKAVEIVKNLSDLTQTYINSVEAKVT